MYITIWEVCEVLQVVKMFCLGSLSRCPLQCKSLSCFSIDHLLTHTISFVASKVSSSNLPSYRRGQAGDVSFISWRGGWFFVNLDDSSAGFSWIVEMNPIESKPPWMKSWSQWETQTWWLNERHESLNVELGLALQYHCIILQRGVRGLLWYPIDLRDDDNWCSV